MFASPERALVFDLNDFDETLPGPFEYDVKRMAASFAIAARNNAFSTADARAVTSASVRAYREAMARFAQMRTMDIWYAHLAEETVLAGARGTAGKKDKERQGAQDGREEHPELLTLRTRPSPRAERLRANTAASCDTSGEVRFEAVCRRVCSCAGAGGDSQ